MPLPTNRSLLLRFSGTFAIRAIYVVLGLAIHLVLANTLGAKGYGAFTFAFAVATVVGLLGSLGSQQLITREVAQLGEAGQWGTVHSLFRFLQRRVMAVSIALAGLVAAVALCAGWPGDIMMRHALLAALVSVPFYALIATRQGALLGLQRLVWSQVPEGLVRPLLLLGAVGVSWWLCNGLGVQTAVWSNTGAMAVAFAAGAVILSRFLPKAATLQLNSGQKRLWWRSTLAFLAISATGVVNSHTDLIMVGSLLGAEDAGVYNIPLRLNAFILFPYLIMEMVLHPLIPGIYASGDKRGLQRMLKRTIRMVWLGSAAMVLALALWRTEVLQWFGPEFPGGATVLLILMAGALLNIAFGSAVYLVSMTGHEKITARAVAISAILNVALNILLIPRYGIEGAAIATVASDLMWKASLWWYARRRLGVDTGVV